MDDAAFIVGLMNHNTKAVGFIPSTAIKQRWMRTGDYVIERDRHGRPRGYLLFGSPTSGRPLFINQTCIETDYRLRGFGLLAVREVIQRAIDAQSTRIRLRCALDLPANAFWIACGFQRLGTSPGRGARKRTIVDYELRLRPDPPPPEPKFILSRFHAMRIIR